MAPANIRLVCDHCGKVNKAVRTQCRRCGRPLRRSESRLEPPPEVAPPAPEAEEAPPPPPEGKRRGKRALVVGLVLAVLGSGVVYMGLADPFDWFAGTGAGPGTTQASISPCDDLAESVFNYLVVVDEALDEALTSSNSQYRPGDSFQSVIPPDVAAQGDALVAEAERLGCPDADIESGLRARAQQHEGGGILIPLIAETPTTTSITQPTMDIVSDG